MLLESIINRTILTLERDGVALVHKKGLDLSFKSVDKEGFKVKGARIISKSTVDYYGVFKGRFLAFETKSVEEDYFPLSNIKKHQWNYLKRVYSNNGISFIILFFKVQERFFLILFESLAPIVKVQRNLRIDECEKIGYQLELNYPGVLNFIDVIDEVIDKNMRFVA